MLPLMNTPPRPPKSNPNSTQRIGTGEKSNLSQKSGGMSDIYVSRERLREVQPDGARVSLTVTEQQLAANVWPSQSSRETSGFIDVGGTERRVSGGVSAHPPPIHSDL